MGGTTCRLWLVLPPLVLGLLAHAPVQAGDWTFTRRLTVSQDYTDNVRLAPAGQEEEELVTQLNPGVSVRGEGRRLDLNFDYRAQSLFYWKDSDRNTTRHQLGADATAELVERALFLDARATVSQQNVFAGGPLALDNVSDTGNRSDVVTYSISPYLRQRFGGYADLEARYTHSEVKVGGTAASDSALDEVDVSLSSGRRSPLLTWAFNYNKQEESRKGARDFESESADGIVGYRVTRSFDVFVQGGYEENDFAGAENFNDGTFWSAGAGWRPSRFFGIRGAWGPDDQSISVALNPSTRTSLNVTYRKRDVGRNPGTIWAGTFELRNRRSTLRARYFEDTTTTQQVLLEQQVFQLVDPFGNPIVDPTGQPVLFSLQVPTLTDDVLERKRLEGFGSIRVGKKSNLDLTVFDESRTFLVAGDREDAFGVRTGWTWRLSRQTTSRANLGWRRTEGRLGGAGTAPDSDLWNFSVGVGHQFLANVNGSVDYRFAKQDSDSAANSYEENRVTARLSMTF